MTYYSLSNDAYLYLERLIHHDRRLRHHELEFLLRRAKGTASVVSDADRSSAFAAWKWIGDIVDIQDMSLRLIEDINFECLEFLLSFYVEIEGLCSPDDWSLQAVFSTVLLKAMRVSRFNDRPIGLHRLETPRISSNNVDDEEVIEDNRILWSTFLECATSISRGDRLIEREQFVSAFCFGLLLIDRSGWVLSGQVPGVERANAASILVSRRWGWDTLPESK